MLLKPQAQQDSNVLNGVRRWPGVRILNSIAGITFHFEEYAPIIPEISNADCFDAEVFVVSIDKTQTPLK